MKILKSLVLIISVIAVSMILSGCGNGGTPTVSSSTTSTQAASISGTIYAPSGVSTSRVAGRMAQASATGKDVKVPNATVTAKRMKTDGTLEDLGADYTTTTDSDGNYTIENVPQEENIIIEASASVTVGTNTKTLKLRKVFTITDTEVTLGSITGVDLDVATTLAVEVMRDIVSTANASLSESEKISGSELPRETLSDLENEIEVALSADQALTTPTVNLLTCLTEGDAEVDTQLTSLENSGNGATLKSKKDKAASKGSLRVHVVVLGGESPLEGATVVVTVDGTVQTGTTDSKGNAFFDEFTVGSSIELEVKKDGYKMVKTSQNIERAAVVNNVTVQMETISTNQAPVAKAGADQTASIGKTVTLDGSSSFDPDGDTLTYSWTQTAGTTVTLPSFTAATATFSPAENATYTFSLTVSDGTLSSEADTVNIAVGSSTTITCSIDTDCDDGNTATIDTCANPGTTSASCSNQAAPAPSAVTVNTPSNASSSSLDLSWSQSTDQSFASYKIYYSTSTGVSQSSTLVGTITNSGTTSSTITGLSQNTNYYISIYICNVSDVCTSSNEVSGTTLIDGTYISGAISSNTTWLLSNSPYVIDGTITVSTGVVLTVEAGTTIYYLNSNSIDLTGSINAAGSSGNLIYFKGADCQSTQAIGLIFNSAESINSSTISYAQFECLHTVMKFNANGGPLSLDNITVTNNNGGTDCNASQSSYAALISYPTAVVVPLNITNSTFSSNTAGSILCANTALTTIENSTFSDNNVDDVITYENNAITIATTTFSNNSGSVIECDGITGGPCDLTVSGSTFSNNAGIDIAGCTSGGTTNISNSSFSNGVVNKASSISYSTFISTQGGTAVTNVPSITYSDISGYDIGVLSSLTTFNNNNLYNNTSYNLKLSNASNVTASNNWWGTTDTGIIDTSIYDSNDDGALGTVSYTPILTSAESTAGAP